MTWLAQLRPLAYARRIARALERIALSLERINDRAAAEWAATHAPRPAPSHPIDFDRFDPLAAQADADAEAAATSAGYTHRPPMSLEEEQRQR